MDNDVQRTDMQTYTKGLVKRRSACVRSALVNELGSKVFGLETQNMCSGSFHLICVSRVVLIKLVQTRSKGSPDQRFSFK